MAIDRISACGLNPQTVQRHLNNALIVEAQNGRLQKVKELLTDKLLTNKLVDINARDEFGNTALHWASVNGHIAVVRELIQKGADVNAKNKTNSTPLHLASGSGQIMAVRELIKNGADATLRDKHGNIPIQLAQKNSHKGAVKELSK